MSDDGIEVPLQSALLLLPASLQAAIVLEHSVAAGWLGELQSSALQRTACRMARNAQVADIEVESNRIIESIRKHLALARGIGVPWLHRQLRAGKLVASAVVGNPLAGRSMIPLEAWNVPEPHFDFHLGYVQHRSWDPQVVTSVVIKSARPIAYTLAVEAHGESRRSRFSLVDRKVQMRAAQLVKDGHNTANGIATLIYRELNPGKHHDRALGATESATLKRWRSLISKILQPPG